jgi:hypothetical protein
VIKYIASSEGQKDLILDQMLPHGFGISYDLFLKEKVMEEGFTEDTNDNQNFESNDKDDENDQDHGNDEDQNQDEDETSSRKNNKDSEDPKDLKDNIEEELETFEENIQNQLMKQMVS